jgi:hypothetical protein
METLDLEPDDPVPASKPKTPYELVVGAADAEGYPYEIEREGDRVIVKVRSKTGTGYVMQALFDSKGEPIAPLKTRVRVPTGDRPPQIELHMVPYDPEKSGVCSTKAPCAGLTRIMELSCVEHGGVIGIGDAEKSAVPDYVAFMPNQRHRDDACLFVLNFCPCCGRKIPA